MFNGIALFEQTLAELLAEEDKAAIERDIQKEKFSIVTPENKTKMIGKKAVEGVKTMPPKYADGGYRQRKYVIEYRFMHEGQRYSVYGKTKEECHKKRTDIIAGRFVKKGQKTTAALKFIDWLLEWIENYKKPNVSTPYYDTMLRYINSKIAPKLGHILLKKITSLDLQKFLNTIEKDNTRTKIASVLSASLDKAYNVQKIRFNPFLAVEYKKAKSKSYPALMPEQQTAVLAAVALKYKNLFVFCCCTGLRISEALGLEVAYIDQKHNLINVNQQMTRSGNLTPILKSDAAYRAVKYLPELLKGFDLSQGLLFNGIKYSAADSYFGRLFERLKFSGLVLHSFRHTFISNCYYVGIKEKQIQVWAGHSKIETTLDTYTHILSGSSQLVEYARKLKKSLDSTPRRTPKRTK